MIKPSSPCFVLEKNKLEKNLALFATLKQDNLQWIYTIKCFHEEEGLECIAQSFNGFSIGNLNELSKLPHTDKKHIHSYAPAFYPHEVLSLAKASHTMSFNSLSQWKAYQKISSDHSSLGLRINPKLSLKQPTYCDSSHENSRFGVDYKIFLKQYRQNPKHFKKLEGLHFHVFCHQGFKALKRLLKHLNTHYKNILPSLKWLNLGGGQNFTDSDYDTKGFIKSIQKFQKTYPTLTLYFEPATTVVENTGYLKTTILDIIDNKVILDTSIETHLLDVAISKRKLKVRHTSKSLTMHRYELTGMSCIAGDIIGTYSFHKPLRIGDSIIFENMIGYTLVKQTEFNGIRKAGFLME